MGKVEKVDVDDAIQEGTFDDGDQTLAVAVGLKLETYSLKTFPKANAALIVAAKKEMLGDASLETILMDLECAGDMFKLASVGLKGTKLKVRVGIHLKDLATLCSDCASAMRALWSDSRNMVSHLIKALRWLQLGQETRAITAIPGLSNGL